MITKLRLKWGLQRQRYEKRRLLKQLSKQKWLDGDIEQTQIYAAILKTVGRQGIEQIRGKKQ